MQKQNQKELRKITRRIEQLEAEMDSWISVQEISETMHSTNDAADLVQLQSELDQLTVQQEAVMEEWAELSEQWNKWKIWKSFREFRISKNYSLKEAADH
ncbi:MAG: ABC transporter C-terminal domain-containing protein [Streptococcus xiaochunlingii]